MTSRKLAIRALNDARRTDPLAYLSLRQTAATVVGVKDLWAREIATRIILGRISPTFVESLQFKEINESGTPEFRNVRFCGGPHQLAEAALIEACSLAGGPFIASKSVYSYRFANRNNTEGLYQPYFELFSKRQDDIGKRCRKHSKHWVVYLDIKSFYPSITKTRIRSVWKKACKESGLDAFWERLGTHFLELQFSYKDGLLIGPQFSHLLANLFLGDFDIEMEKRFPHRYFRYVDDFAFVVRPEEKDGLLEMVATKLKPLGLRLNDGKTQWMGAEKWTKNAPFQTPEYEDDFIGDERWMLFIDQLKRYLISNPADGTSIREAFESEGIRIPVPRYEAAIQSELYQIGLERRRRRKGFAEATAELSISSIVDRALDLRAGYLQEFDILWPDFQAASGLIRKWKRSRIRYLIGRCLLVARVSELIPLYEAVRTDNELSEYSAMLEAIVTGNVDGLLRFGWKPASAIAPAISTAGIRLRTSRKNWSQESLEALSALRLGGATVAATVSANASQENRYLVSMANFGPSDWVKEADPFYRELKSLAGDRTFEDFIKSFQTPIDPDEDWSVFSEELLGLNPT
ncbi:MAG: RNA-directed DNA polymerase [Verrucomicrobiales bacterium]